jgi:hypothetical protein
MISTNIPWQMSYCHCLAMISSTRKDPCLKSTRKSWLPTVWIPARCVETNGRSHGYHIRKQTLIPAPFFSEYSLSGSYRKIVHVPGHLSWKHMRYNDPDIALSQSDEDKLLGLDPPPTDEEAKEGKFAALQVRLTLGTSSYATMALR